jgi:peptidoglycan/xylan/chitin deacetylase (PgdA/CDA1 family)
MLPSGMVRPLLACLALVACGPAPAPSAPPATPEPASVAPTTSPPGPRRPVTLPAVAITIDDLVVGGRDLEDHAVAELTDRMIAHLVAADAPAVAFVNADKLHQGVQRQARIRMLRAWTAAGVELGNHTYSHPSLQDTPLARFEADVIRGEPEIRALNAEQGWPLRWFRHPYLRTGPSLEVRAAFEKFLEERRYTVAPVTLDTSDWLFNFVYTDADARHDRELMARVAATYMTHMDEMLTFHEQAAQRVVGRPIRHILLLHANKLNAEFLDDVITLYRGRGYTFITLEEALADDAYRLPDRYAGPAGVTWLYRWDVTRGEPQFDWKSEPRIPPAIQAAYDAAQRG